MVEERPFAASRSFFNEVIGFLLSEDAQHLTHGQLERELEHRGRELLRNLLQGHLDARGMGEVDSPVCGADGFERTWKRPRQRGLESVFGTVEVKRLGFGGDGLASLHPLDAELNLPPESYSHEVRRRVAEEIIKSSFDDAMQSIARNTGAVVPKRQVEELVVRAATDFDAFYKERRAGPEAAHAQTGSVLVVSIDGKGVVMIKSGLREATRKAAERSKHKLDKRLSRGEKRNRKRMATVAAVYTIAPFVRTPEEIACTMAPISEQETVRRPRPENKRVWASVKKEPEQVIEEAVRDALHRDPTHDKTWVALVDGNKHQLRLLRKLSRRHGADLMVVLDIMHAVEYLWKAGLSFYEEGSKELQVWVTERLLQVMRGRAAHVAAGIRRSATLRKLSPKKRKAADVCADYFLTYKSFMRYDQYLAAGLPIASGVIEGACRHLVKDRMDLTGARWGLASAEAVLQLRALRSSNDFDDYWPFHEAQEYERNHAAQYAEGKPPTTVSSPGSTLRH